MNEIKPLDTRPYEDFYGITNEIKSVNLTELLAMDLKVHELAQRNVIAQHVIKFRKYFLSGIEYLVEKELGVTDAIKKSVNVPPLSVFSLKNDANKTLYLIDGQHRVEGLKLAIGFVEKKIEDLKDILNKDKIKTVCDRYDIGYTKDEIQLELNKTYIVSELLKNRFLFLVVNYGELDLEDAQQLFYDINATAKKSPNSLNVSFNRNDLLSKLTTDVAQEYPSYVCIDRERIENKELLTLASLKKGFDAFLGNLLSNSKKDMENLKSPCRDLMNIFIDTLPDEYENNEEYFYTNQGVFTGVARYAKILRELELDSELVGLDWKKSLEESLKKINFSRFNVEFCNIGKIPLNEDGALVFSGTGNKIRAIFQVLIQSGLRTNSSGEVIRRANGKIFNMGIIESDVKDDDLDDGVNGEKASRTDDVPTIKNKIIDFMEMDKLYGVQEIAKGLGLKVRDSKKYALELAEEGKLVEKKVSGKRVLFARMNNIL